MIFIGLYFKYNHSNNPIEILYLLTLIRLSDIVKYLEDYINLNDMTQRFVQLIKLLFSILVVAHFFACFWYYISKM